MEEKDTFYLHDLARILGLPPHRDVELQAFPIADQARNAAKEAAIQKGYSEEEAKAFGSDAAMRVIGFVADKWYNQFANRVNESFPQYNLQLLGISDTMYRVKPAPGKTWMDAALLIAKKEGLTTKELRFIKRNPRGYVLESLWHLTH